VTSLINAESLPFFLQFVAPGFIILYFRSLFLTGRMPPLGESVAASAILSVLYQAAVLPLQGAVNQDVSGHVHIWALLVFICPALLGSGLGFLAQKGWIRRILRKLKLNPVHTIGTAWDWQGGRINAGFVIIQMTDGEIIRGYVAENSFFSSDPKERDIFVELLYGKGEDGSDWIKQGSSIWIAGPHIKSIEFIPDDRGPEIEEDTTNDGRK